ENSSLLIPIFDVQHEEIKWMTMTCAHRMSGISTRPSTRWQIEWKICLHINNEKRMEKEGALAEDNALVHQGGGGEPLESPSSSSSLSSYPHSHHSNSQQKLLIKSHF